MSYKGYAGGSCSNASVSDGELTLKTLTKKAKKFSALLAAFMIILSACGCGSGSEKAEKNNKEKESEAETVLLEKGEYITFGTYEQDNDESNGKEDIEWLVLDCEDGKALVISKYVLDCVKYCEKYSEVTWETSDLRAWLNSDFADTAFTDSEKEKICISTVESDKHPDRGEEPGVTVQDNLFILSVSEAEEYFAEDKDRLCEATEYAKANGVVITDGYCRWWLRTPNYFSAIESYVNVKGKAFKGDVDDGYSHVNNAMNGVRPVMWINL